MRRNLESYLALIDLDGSVVIQSRDDKGNVHHVDVIELDPGSTLNDADSQLDEMGYQIERFDFCGVSIAVAIVCHSAWLFERAD
jgi:hypothetical protein